MSHVVIRPKVLYVGTPVFLVSTVNADGSFNLAPASSYWALEQMLVLGLETDGQSAQNVLERPELVVSFPHPELWPAVEKLADVTGRDPVPETKAARYRFEPHEILDPAKRGAARAAVAELVALAASALDGALAFTLLIPRREARLRLFCVWPIFLAARTLGRVLEDERGLLRGARIRRSEVRRCLSETTALVWSNRGLRWLYARARIGLGEAPGGG